MKKRFFIPVLFIAGAALLWGCGQKIKPGTAGVKRPVVEGVVTGVVSPSRITDEYEAAGTVVSRNLSVISSRLMGTISSVRVQRGDRVRKGQILATIASPETADKAAQARQGVEEAIKAVEMAQEHKALTDTTYRRMKSLYDEKAITRQEFDEMTTKKAVAELDLAQASAALARMRAGEREAEVYSGYAVLRSPVTGIVVDKKADPGTMALPGMPILSVEVPRYQVETSLDEKFWGKVRPGMELSIEVPSTGYKAKAPVAEVVPSIDPMARSFDIKLDVPPTLTSGQFVKVYVPQGERDAIMVPSGAVLDRGQLQFVYVVGPDGVIQLRVVRTGKTVGDEVEIASGLNAGERIITGGLDKAKEGAVVKEARTDVGPK